jgi:hypothetical protein
MEFEIVRNALINEIFIAYRESGAIYRKTANGELRGEMEMIRLGLERMLKNLLPLGEQHEKVLEKLRVSFNAAGAGAG